MLTERAPGVPDAGTGVPGVPDAVTGIGMWTKKMGPCPGETSTEFGGHGRSETTIPK